MNKNIRFKAIFIAIIALVVVGAILSTLLQFTQNRSLEERTLRLKWLANVGFIGELYADTYGYFINDSLSIKVLPGGPEHDAIRELETGDAHFGIASADQVIKAREKDADVVVIAQIYQQNPVQWIYRSDSMIVNKPMDLKDKVIGITIGDNDQNIMLALLKKYNIDTISTTLRPVQFSFIPFTKGDVQLFPVYRNTQGVELKRQLENDGENVAFFDPSLHEVNLVANSVVTTSRIVRDERALVIKFLRTLLRGWHDSLLEENEELAFKAMMIHAKATGHPDTLKSIILDQIKETRKLVLPEGFNSLSIGKIDTNGWKMTEAILKKRGIIQKNVNIINSLHTDIYEEAKLTYENSDY